MTDIAHYMGNDLSLGPTGDLAPADGVALGQQRVLRRLLTNPLDYIWQPAYGGGLGQMVGLPANPQAIQGSIRAQMFQEAAVQQNPAPVVTVTSDASNDVFAQITYTDADSGAVTLLTVPLS